jgi:PAS domain S-box-containing protein
MKPSDPIHQETGIGVVRCDLNLNNCQDMLFEGTHDAALIMEVTADRQFIYAAANQNYLKVTGFSLDDLIGKTPVEVHGEVTGRHIVAHLKICLKLRKMVQYDETITISGQVRTATVRLTPRITVDGTISHIFSSTRDMTDQKEAEYLSERAKKEPGISVYQLIGRHCLF